MKKEQAILGAIAVAIIGFAVGRIFSPGDGGGEADKAKTETSKTTVAAAKGVAMPVKGSPTKGPAEAKVTIIEFSDFQ